MKKIHVVPCVSIENITFGCDRKNARKGFGKKYKEFKKSPLSENTTDAYDTYHVYYSRDDKFEAIEIFGDVNVIIDEVTVFPGEIDKAMMMFPGMKEDEGDFIDVEKSIAMSVSPDDPTKIESILFGCKNYYI